MRVGVVGESVCVVEAFRSQWGGGKCHKSDGWFVCAHQHACMGEIGYGDGGGDGVVHGEGSKDVVDAMSC